MNKEQMIEFLEELKYRFVLDQEYKLASNLREVIKFLKLQNNDINTN